MKITREWAMPNKNTFGIPCINKLIWDVINFHHDCKGKPPLLLDPFVGNSPFNNQISKYNRFISITNDLDPCVAADHYVDAIDFLKNMEPIKRDPEIYGYLESFLSGIDIVLLDPPFSPRQVSESYKKLGKTVNMQTTQASYWSNLKKEISRIIKPGGTVVSCAWNSGGIGKKYGFEIDQIMLVAHGGWHNDTIVTVEHKI